MVQLAWIAECKRLDRPSGDKIAHRTWYEAELAAATGKSSTSECDAKGDYEDAMAHFEAIVGASIYWQLRRARGDARRILHEVQKLAADFDCSDEYMLGIARRSLRREEVSWEHLEPEELLTILRALKIQVRRQHQRGDQTDRPRNLEVEPW